MVPWINALVDLGKCMHIFFTDNAFPDKVVSIQGLSVLQGHRYPSCADPTISLRPCRSAHNADIDVMLQLRWMFAKGAATLSLKS